MPASTIPHPGVLVANVGVFGGSFNPIHRGHLAVAEEAAARCGLDRVLFVVAADPPHKSPAGLAPAADRLAIVKVALRGHGKFEASDLEIRRGGTSFTVDTLEQLKRTSPTRTRLHLIIGADSLEDFPGWREPAKILSLASLVVARRPGKGVSMAGLRGLLPRGAKPVILDAEVDISSTEIRRRLAAGQPADDLLPPGVDAAIRRRGLYGTAR